MPKYLPLMPLTSSFLLLNLRPLYRNDEQFAHCIVNGNIMRTAGFEERDCLVLVTQLMIVWIFQHLPVTKLSFGFFPLGTSLGSKSGICELQSVLAKT